MACVVGAEFLRSDDDPSWRMTEEDVPVGTAMKAAEVRSLHTAALQEERARRLQDFQKCCQKRVATRRSLQRPVESCPKSSEEEVTSKDAPDASQELTKEPKAEASSKPPETTKKVCIKPSETEKKAEACKKPFETTRKAPMMRKANLPKPRAARSALKAAAKVAAREASKQELQALELKADEKSGGRAPPIPASLQDSPAKSSPSPEKHEKSDQASSSGDSCSNAAARTRRYTTGLLSLMLRAYAKCGRPPPLLCPCIPRPEGPAPTLGGDGNVVLSKAWEAYIQKIADSAENHAENCEFATGHTSLQKQVLSLIQSAKQ